jgi:hypothetical protein
MAFPIRVQATELGFYGGRRIRFGDVFTLKSEKEFSERWMRKLKPGERPLEADALAGELGVPAPAGEDPEATPPGPAKAAPTVKAAPKAQPKQAGTGDASVL